jgi:hypothetical protein
MVHRQDRVASNRARTIVPHPKHSVGRNTSFSLEDICNTIDDRDSVFFGYLGYFFDVDAVSEVVSTDVNRRT